LIPLKNFSEQTIFFYQIRRYTFTPCLRHNHVFRNLQLPMKSWSVSACLEAFLILAEVSWKGKFTWKVKSSIPLAHRRWVWGRCCTGRVGRLKRCWRRWCGWGCRRRITARVQMIYCWWMLLQSKESY